MVPPALNFLESCHCCEIIHIWLVYSTSVYVIFDSKKEETLHSYTSKILQKQSVTAERYWKTSFKTKNKWRQQQIPIFSPKQDVISSYTCTPGLQQQLIFLFQRQNTYK